MILKLIHYPAAPEVEISGENKLDYIINTVTLLHKYQ
jgi:hypothetical protein